MRALVLGAAPCLWADLRAVLPMGFDRCYAVNGAGVRWPLTDVWCTGHPEAMERWQRAVVAQGRPVPEVVAPRRHEGCKVDRVEGLFWDGQPRDARRLSSAIYAVKVALADGAVRVVLCGVALDASGHLDASKAPGHDYAVYRRAFAWAKGAVFAGRVRAASGYLADLLGAPDREWMGC